MPFDPANLMYPNVPVVKEFSKISGYDRVLSNLTGEATTYYRLASVDGYDAVYNKRYGEFIASLNNGQFQDAARSVVEFPKNGLYTKQAINLLGIKYIVYKLADGHAIWTFPFWNYPAGTFSLLYNDGVYQVLENNNAFPRAFLVNKFTVENNPQTILSKMFSSNFDLRHEIVLEQNLNQKLSGQGTAQIKNYSADKISIETNSAGNNLLFLSDAYYPGWQAYVDGRETKIYRADFTFRAILVPAGRHQIQFIFNPLSFGVGVAAAIFGLLLIASFTVMQKRNFISKTRT